MHVHDNCDVSFVTDAVHARHVWWTGSVEGLLYLQRGAGGFLLPLELGRLCYETLLKNVLFQNVCIHDLQTDRRLPGLSDAMNTDKCCI